MALIDILDEERVGARLSGRRLVLNLLGMGLMQTLAGCGEDGVFAGKAKTLTVVMYSYLDRPIFDIKLNDEPLGAANAYGTTSMVTGVTVHIGKQILVWTLGGPEGKPGNGEVVTLKNDIAISADAIPGNSAYMGLYLYPGDTAEFTFERYMPGHSARGEVLMTAAGKSGP